MANINDFKILNTKCLAYFNLLEKELGYKIRVPNEKTKERFGFYIFMLETICNVKDISDIINLITDTDFNKTVRNFGEDDQGIDAIFIDEEHNNLNLFNFKFREKFNADKKQSLNETIISTKFTNAILTEKTSHLPINMMHKADEIIEKLNSSEVWKFRLYVISNDTVELDNHSSQIKQLKDLYDLEVVPIGLETISKEMSIRPKPIGAKVHLSKDSIMPYVESSLSSSKSFIVRISASELIRITCDSEELRNNYSIEDISPLSNVKMEYNLLFDNVRGLVVRSKFNDNIYNTLKTEPSKFFMYNNGLTLTASDIISEDTNANKKIKITLHDFQVVNGGQTLRTLHRFNQESNDTISKYLSNCEILLRVFKTTAKDNLKNKIAEYTNSQNAISNIDLKSLSSEQIQIEQYLDENDIIYARKAGDTGISKNKSYLHKISMEKFGQILFSISGFPEKASNQKKQIFDKYYSQIFDEANFDLTKSVEFIKRYYEIKSAYEGLGEFESSDQKIFYILYMDKYFNFDTIREIRFLENRIREFIPNDKNISDARKLVQIKFKDFIDLKIKNHTQAFNF